MLFFWMGFVAVFAYSCFVSDLVENLILFRGEGIFIYACVEGIDKSLAVCEGSCMDVGICVEGIGVNCIHCNTLLVVIDLILF